MLEHRISIKMFAILYVIAWLVSPPLAYDSIYRIIAVLALLYLFATSYSGRFYRNNNRLVMAIALCIYMGFIGIMVGDQFALRINVYILMLVGVISDMWCSDENNVKTLRLVLVFSFALYIIWSLTTLKGIASNPRVMRDLVKNNTVSYSLSKMGVGGYGFIYGEVLALPIGIHCALNKQFARTTRFVATIFTVIGYYLVFQSQYFMALVLAVSIIPMMFIARIDNSRMRVCAYLIVILLLITIAVNLGDILIFLINRIDLSVINRKLVDAYEILVEGGDIAASDFSTRVERYSRDISAIFAHPILGSFSYSSTGKHSHILDFFTQYGIPLGCVHLNLLFFSCNDWRKKGMQIASVVLLITFIFACMNTLPFSAAGPLYIMLPAYCKLIGEESCPKY